MTKLYTGIVAHSHTFYSPDWSVKVGRCHWGFRHGKQMANISWGSPSFLNKHCVGQKNISILMSDKSRHWNMTVIMRGGGDETRLLPMGILIKIYEYCVKITVSSVKVTTWACGLLLINNGTLSSDIKSPVSAVFFSFFSLF